MSLAAFADVIGIGSAALTTVGFLQSNWPTYEPEGATVTIKAGLPKLDEEDDSLNGDINKIYAFDNRNGYSGQADGGHIDDGGILTKTIGQETPGLRAEYVSVSNNNDATCIAWISVTQYDKTRGGAWTGDLGSECGQPFHYSQESAGKKKGDSGDYDGDDYFPNCAWLDGDHSNDIQNSALKFDVSAYAEDAVDVTLENGACGYTIWGSENGPIADAPAKRDLSNSTRTPVHLRERPSYMKNQLLMSGVSYQTADKLCKAEKSWGPDFVGPDGLYCDMETKTTSPLCSAQQVDGCVDVDETDGAVQVKRRSTVARRSVSQVHKSYKKISKWGGA